MKSDGSVRTRARRRFRAAVAVAAATAGLALVAGTRGRDPTFDRVPDVPTMPLNGEVLTADERLGAPFALAVVGDRLLASDAFGDRAIHVIRRADGRLERSLGRRGEGPGEFRVAASLTPSAGEPDVAWAYDFGLFRLTRVGLDEDFPESARREGGIVRLQGDVPLLTPVWIGDSLIISLGFFPYGRLGHFAPDGSLRETTGPLPPGDAGIPTAVRQHAYQSVLRALPDGTRLAVAARYAGRIELYRADGHLAALAEVPFPFEPTYEVGESGGVPVFVSGPALRYAYLDLAVTEDRLYALFSGRRRGEVEGANLGRHVHVFDWEGRLRGALELDAPLAGLTVDPEGTMLYGARPEPVPAIVAYPLPGSRDAG